jgi:Asp-tRNA(Asn)/Glu-tRNA(Gln) amidotransferase A subunit family amidase
MSDPSVWREHGAPLVPPLGSGPLDGLTVAVKDLFAVAGFPVGAGNPTWLSQAKPEPADAWAVHALREAGAAIAGIARTDELAFSLSGANAHYGTPPNPAAPDLVTGGSSSGPAAAVAAGQADIGLGTDTGGSVRVPASVCGLFGLRPTHGAVRDEGVLHLAPSFDTVGWMTADPSLLAATGSVLLPPAPAELSCWQKPAGPPRRLLSFDVPNVRGRLLADALGLTLVAGPVLDDDAVTELLTAFRAVQAAEAWELHGRWITANPGALGADVEARFRAGADVDASARRRARAVIAGYRSRFLDVLGDDAWLVLPAAAGPGHARGASPEARDAWRQATLRLTVAASAFGLPSCVLPTGTRPPEGIALVGPPGADHALLAAASRAAASMLST